MIEPIMGEGGIKVIPDWCLKELRKLCNKKKILLILDEVQCGISRSGNFLAFEKSKIKPDIVPIAKGIGGGFPIGAVLMNKKVSASMLPGTHGSTFGGNPLAMACGNTVMDIVTSKKFLKNVNNLSKYFFLKLNQLKEKFPKIIKEIRGIGLLIGIPAKDLRKIIVDAKKRKVLRRNLNNLDLDKGTPLKGKLLIQMFEKSSLRTRLSFYLAIKQLGGSTLTLRPDELHLSKGAESIEDTARILSNFGNAFMLRTDSDKKLTEFKKHLSIPIINGLSPSSHATQILSDIFTVEEIKKESISKLNITWIGDSNNVLNSLIAASIKFSFKLNIGCPKNYEPNNDIKNYIKKNKNKISIYNDAKKAATNADVIFSDKVISMNDKVNKTKKLKHFKKFKINKQLLNYAKKDCIFLHCLPRGKEVDEEIFYSKQSKVWEQALNRIHVQKSILLYCFGKLR